VASTFPARALRIKKSQLTHVTSVTCLGMRHAEQFDICACFMALSVPTHLAHSQDDKPLPNGAI